MNSRICRSKSGFTLVEIIIVALLALSLIIMSFKVFSFIQHQRTRGSVDLQELQGARLAINYLRRDLRGAVPKIAATATLEQKRKALQMPMVKAEKFDKSSGNVPIVVADEEIHFFKYVFKSTSVLPELEEVNYFIDKKRKCLVRAGAGAEKVFPDIKGAKFELYAHPLKKEMPLLRVNLLIGTKKGEQISAENMEITTTISSAIISQNLNNTYWHAN